MTKLEPIKGIKPIALITYLCSYDCPHCGVGANDLGIPAGHVTCLDLQAHFKMKPGVTPCYVAIPAAKRSGVSRSPREYGEEYELTGAEPQEQAR